MKVYFLGRLILVEPNLAVGIPIWMTRANRDKRITWVLPYLGRDALDTWDNLVPACHKYMAEQGVTVGVKA